MPMKKIRNRSGICESVRQFMIRTVHAGKIKMKGLLSICREFWLDEQ
jgi:hypothetical protein